MILIIVHLVRNPPLEHDIIVYLTGYGFHRPKSV